MLDPVLPIDNGFIYKSHVFNPINQEEEQSIMHLSVLEGQVKPLLPLSVHLSRVKYSFGSVSHAFPNRLIHFLLHDLHWIAPYFLCFLI